MNTSPQPRQVRGLRRLFIVNGDRAGPGVPGDRVEDRSSPAAAQPGRVVEADNHERLVRGGYNKNGNSALSGRRCPSQRALEGAQELPVPGHVEHEKGLRIPGEILAALEALEDFPDRGQRAIGPGVLRHSPIPLRRDGFREPSMGRSALHWARVLCHGRNRGLGS